MIQECSTNAFVLCSSPVRFVPEERGCVYRQPADCRGFSPDTARLRPTIMLAAVKKLTLLENDVKDY